MKRHLIVVTMMLLLAAFSLNGQPARREANYAGNRVRFKALVYYTEYAEEAHVQFAHQTIRFFKKLTDGEGFVLDTTTSIAGMSVQQLSEYSIIICPDGLPSSQKERPLFERYMDNGGGCLAFHASGYNDRNTKWAWLQQFLGCGYFKCNNWPPQPALLEVDENRHPITANLPKEFVAPASEWYQWNDDLRSKPNIKVLLSLSEKNYPIGIKDIVYGGDWPVVWINTDYRMVYLNMGHGDEEFMDATQNLLFINAFRWVVGSDTRDPFDNFTTK